MLFVAGAAAGAVLHLRYGFIALAVPTAVVWALGAVMGLAALMAFSRGQNIHQIKARRLAMSPLVSRHWPIKWQLLSSSISRTNKLRSIPVTVRHSMDCPFESPINAA